VVNLRSLHRRTEHLTALKLVDRRIPEVQRSHRLRSVRDREPRGCHGGEDRSWHVDSLSWKPAAPTTVVCRQRGHGIQCAVSTSPMCARGFV
jgi:hypothetical protein